MIAKSHNKRTITSSLFVYLCMTFYYSQALRQLINRDAERADAFLRKDKKISKNNNLEYFLLLVSGQMHKLS